MSIFLQISYHIYGHKYSLFYNGYINFGKDQNIEGQQYDHYYWVRKTQKVRVRRILLYTNLRYKEHTIPFGVDGKKP